MLAAIGVESASTVAKATLTVGSQRLVHRLGQPAVHPFDHVAVGVERNVYAAVPQKLLYELGVSGSPVLFKRGLKCRPRRFVTLMVVPIVVGNTGPLSCQREPTLSSLPRSAKRGGF